MASLNVVGSALKYRNILVVIKQTAFEEYSQVSQEVPSAIRYGVPYSFVLTIVIASQLKLRGQAPKALRWKRLEQRYNAHKQCVNDLLGVLRHHQVNFSCVNRVELDRQHLADIDLMVAVGGDGTVLSAAHFLDHGTIPLLGINSDPNVSVEDRKVKKKVVDERRSVGQRSKHGTLSTIWNVSDQEFWIGVIADPMEPYVIALRWICRKVYPVFFTENPRSI